MFFLGLNCIWNPTVPSDSGCYSGKMGQDFGRSFSPENMSTLQWTLGRGQCQMRWTNHSTTAFPREPTAKSMSPSSFRSSCPWTLHPKYISPGPRSAAAIPEKQKEKNPVWFVPLPAKSAFVTVGCSCGCGCTKVCCASSPGYWVTEDAHSQVIASNLVCQRM